MRYEPSTSNLPAARTIGCGNWPWAHPTARLQPESVTDRQAPSPVHRPVASGPSPGRRWDSRDGQAGRRILRAPRRARGRAVVSYLVITLCDCAAVRSDDRIASEVGEVKPAAAAAAAAAGTGTI